MLAKLRSRKFLAALFGALYIILTDGLGIYVPQHVYDYVKDIILFYIGAEATVDWARAAVEFFRRKQEAA